MVGFNFYMHALVGLGLWFLCYLVVVILFQLFGKDTE